MSIANIDDWTLEALEALQNNTSRYYNSIDYSTSNDMSVMWQITDVNDLSLNESSYRLYDEYEQCEQYNQHYNYYYATENKIPLINTLSKDKLSVTYSIKSKEISRFDLLDID